MRIVMTDFALSHFDATEHEPAIPETTPYEFEGFANSEQPIKIQDGYAPFCKLLFFWNWTTARIGIVPISSATEPFIKSAYEARRETELPVLMRYFPGELLDVRAKYLCLVVYDKEQMAKEGTQIDGDYAIVNILRLCEVVEPPMPPITMMRNALGIKEGGSGVPLDRERYLASVEYWSKNVAVKPKANK